MNSYEHGTMYKPMNVSNGLDKAMNITYTHGCTLRYEFNAKRSGILVQRERFKEHIRNVLFRCFSIGKTQVNERLRKDL